MKPSDRFKTCAHCDAKIPVEVVICPHCSSSLSTSSNEGGPRIYSASKSSENLASLYNPPYASQRASPSSVMEEKKQDAAPSLPKSTAKAAVLEKPSEKSEILPISLLVLGSNLLVIGLMQLFFADGGLLKLEWNADLWYVYSLLGLPMLAFGVKALKTSS